MKKLLRFELLLIILGAVSITFFVFRQYFFSHKTLFPSNLLMSSFSPWKYEPVPEYPNGPPNKPIGFDNIRQFYPNRKFLSEEVKKGSIPLWNPYIYSGAPFMSTFDSAVWYPLTWVAFLFSAIDGWDFMVLVQPALSFVFMFLFLRSLSFSKGMGIFGSLVYTFSGWMVVYWQEALVVEHSFLWLPLALYASNRLWIKHSDVVSWSLLILALLCSIFGGYFQMSLYVYITVVAWNIFQYYSGAGNDKKRSLVKITGAIVLSILCASIQIIPSIEAFLTSPRGVGDGAFIFRDFLLPIQHLVTFIAPDFWGNPATYNYFGGRGFYFEKMLFFGLVPLSFALYALIAVKDTAVRFWKILAVIALSMGFALPTSWWPYYLQIPVLSNSYPTRIFAVSLFSLVLLACYGLRSFLKKPNYKKIIGIAVTLTLALISMWVFVASTWCITNSCLTNNPWVQTEILRIWKMLNISFVRADAHLYATVSLRNLIVPSVFLVSMWALIIVSKFSMKAMYAGALIISLVSSWYFAWKYVYVGERRFLYPDLAVTHKISEISGYDRVWGYGNAFIEANIPLYYRWFSPDGYSGLSSTRYAQLLSTITNNGKIRMVRRSDTDLYNASERDAFSSSNAYRLRMMELLGVKYVIESKKGELKDTNTTENRFSKEAFSLLWEDDVWRIWRYLRALPRAFFATSYTVEQSDEKIIDALYSPDANINDTVLLEKKPSEPMNIVGQSQLTRRPFVEITAYRPNNVTIQSDSDSDGFVVLTDNYYPGWKVYVDGEEQELYRADYSFRSVFVPAGVHTISFVYMPFSVLLGGVLSLVGIALFIGCRKLITGKLPFSFP